MTVVQERWVVALNALLMVAICVAALVGCGGITQTQADSTDAQVKALCGTAMSLAPLAGPMSVDIMAACGTATVVADLATKPGAVAYLNGIIAKVPH